MIPEDFRLILDELDAHPIPINRYRNIAGAGRSQTFGVVCRRCLSPDYSRQCWKRPLLYQHLLAFGQKHVQIPWTSITLNDDYKSLPHRDKGNIGDSFIVAFGEYSGGQLVVSEGPLQGSHDIRYTPIVGDFASATHHVSAWEGRRCSLVFYTAKNAENLPQGSVRVVDGKLVFYRGDAACYGLPHPLRGRKKTPSLP